ncbi:MAG: hypothetical protein HY279_08830 [Nitrospinae bacterium]|nr:hypothetical protein [Nitrospinota bacterium]
MTKEILINKTVDYLKNLPDEKVAEVADFTEYLYQKYEEYIFNRGIRKLASESKSFEFLKEEEDLYTVNDLKEKYK